MKPLTYIGDRFRAAAEVEANTPITIPGKSTPPAARPVPGAEVNWLALAKLIELRRREHHLSAEGLANAAEVRLEEVVQLERGMPGPVAPRTIQRLALALQLPEQRLLELAGLAQGNGPRLREATIRFEARARSVDALRAEEQEALKEYVALLTAS